MRSAEIVASGSKTLASKQACKNAIERAAKPAGAITHSLLPKRLPRIAFLDQLQQ